MKLLFLVMELPENLNITSMYWDLARMCHEKGYEVTVISQNTKGETVLEQYKGIRVLRVKSLAIEGQHNFIKKGFAMISLPYFYKRAFKKSFGKERFDWVVMPTPPITLIPFVEYLKKECCKRFYLLLRDIHPQSIASIGLLNNRLMFRFLENKAKRAYKIADLIGCMTKGNIDFLRGIYPELSESKFTILNNWLTHIPVEGKSTTSIREKYNLNDKFVVLFGGNIGVGQRIENIIFLARHYMSNDKVRFVIIGKGVEKDRLQKLTEQENLSNIQFIAFMPQQDYLQFVESVDLGLISINENYTVPTCPSKACSYMAMGIPVLAMINPNNDYVDFINNSGAGYAVIGSEREKVIKAFDEIYASSELRRRMSVDGHKFYKKYLSTNIVASQFINQIENV